MTQGSRLASGAALALLSLTACSGSPVSPASGPKTRAAATVVIVDRARTVGAFTPGSVTVQAGETVRWVNRSEEEHDVVFDEISLGASKTLLRDDAFEMRFLAPGTYRYVCEFHAGMQGTVVVSSTRAPVR